MAEDVMLEIPEDWGKDALTAQQVAIIPPEHLPLARDMSAMNKKLDLLAKWAMQTQHEQVEMKKEQRCHSKQLKKLWIIRTVTVWFLGLGGTLAGWVGIYNLLRGKKVP